MLRVDTCQERKSFCLEGGGWLVVVKSALQKGQTGKQLVSGDFIQKGKQNGADCGQEGESLSLEGGGMVAGGEVYHAH